MFVYKCELAYNTFCTGDSKCIPCLIRDSEGMQGQWVAGNWGTLKIFREILGTRGSRFRRFFGLSSEEKLIEPHVSTPLVPLAEPYVLDAIVKNVLWKEISAKIAKLSIPEFLGQRSNMGRFVAECCSSWWCPLRRHGKIWECKYIDLSN